MVSCCVVLLENGQIFDDNYVRYQLHPRAKFIIEITTEIAMEMALLFPLFC